MRRINKIVLPLMLSSVICSVAAEPKFNYIPTFHGAFRGRFEADAHSGDQRFEVRNARVSMEGGVAPTISYKVQVDLCDQGKMKILDAYGRLDLSKEVYFQGGQFRMPFGVEAFRGPANYYFSNRSFIAKQVMNYRAVGAKLGYKVSNLPLTVEAGVFNPTAIGEHNVWNRTLAYSGKLVWTIDKQWTAATGYASIRPGEQRANLIDAALGYKDENWYIQGEYMYEHYCNDAFKDCHSYAVFADWHRPCQVGVFNQWSVQMRYDGMTDHMSLSGTGSTFDAARDRLTIGSTLTYKYKKLRADVRLNYEKYTKWDEEGASPDRIVAEMVISF